jgi:hypothetical protein
VQVVLSFVFVLIHTSCPKNARQHLLITIIYLTLRFLFIPVIFNDL